MFGLYGILLALLAAGLTALALLWHQRWSLPLLALGIALTAFLFASVYLNVFLAIYHWVNIYLVMFLAAMLLFAGGFGLSVKCTRLLFAWLQKPHRPLAH